MGEIAGPLSLPGLGWARQRRDGVTDATDAPDCWREDRALVERMLAGDEAAFAEFARDCIPALYRFARRRLRGDEELTRDIVQSTLCVAFAKLGQFRGKAALTTWLCACCRNEIAAYYRRAGRLAAQSLDAEPLAELRLAAPGPGADRELLRREDAALVHRALDALPRPYGAVLEWKYLDDLTVDQIAARLERGTKAAESLLTRARAAFREIYRRLVERPESEPMDDDR
jgi:RNA polymerase sigma-70 factor (ECF subfamily)